MELIKIENNQLLVADKVIDQIRNLEIEKKLIEEKEKEFKEKLIKIYEENGIDRSSNFESYDKSLKISYTPKTVNYTFSSKVLQEKYPDIYRECLVKSERKGSIRITVRDKEEF
jgi:hypothetical protein